MEGHGYSALREINCVVHWFQFWTTYQKQKFLDDLVEKAMPNKVDLLLGALGEMNMRDRPPNLFECQLRLFGQWFEKWSIEHQNLFLEKLESFDPAFVASFYELVKQGSNLT